MRNIKIIKIANEGKELQLLDEFLNMTRECQQERCTCRQNGGRLGLGYINDKFTLFREMGVFNE